MASGIVNLQTDLKSLQFANTSLNGTVPYVVKNIGDTAANQLPGGGGLLSGLLEGGLGTEIGRRIDDTTRISKMLVDKPGIKFLIKQALLQQVGLSRKLQDLRDDGKTKVGAIIKQAATTAFNTAKIGVSILAQVPVAGTGVHFVSGFRTDTYLRNRFTLPPDPASDPEYNETPPGEQETPIANPDPITRDRRLLGAPLALAKQPIEGTIDSNFYNPETDNIAQIQQGDALVENKYYGELSADPSQSDDVDPNISVNVGTSLTYLSSKQSVKKTIVRTNGNGDTTVTEIDFKDTTQEGRLKLGSQGGYTSEGKQSAKRNNTYWYMDGYGETGKEDPDEKAVKDKDSDYINRLDVGTGYGVLIDEVSDLIKFRFDVLEPGKQSATILFFRAYLDSFNDNYTGQWNPVKYLGRGEDFQIYGGFQRKISLSFKIAASTRREMRPLYRKMLYLASTTAPTYSSQGQFMRGTITRLTLGDYLYEQPGVINSLTYTWQPEYPWETRQLTTTGTQKGDPLYDNDMQQLPMVMDCQLEFTPIHTFTPETGVKEYFTHGEIGVNSYT